MIRKYEGGHKSPVNAKPTKRNHYLDEEIRLNCSPGPASTFQSMQILETIRIRGPRSLYSNRNGQKKLPILMRLLRDRRSSTSLHPIDMMWKTAGPRKKSKSKISVRRPTLLILVSTKRTRLQGRALTISEHNLAKVQLIKNGLLILR